MQFADVKNDIAFRKIFGNETKTEILISFLNAVLKLEGNRQIAWVEILNPYQVPIVLGAKSTILDVKAKDKAGNEYIVEMQVTDKLGSLIDKWVYFIKNAENLSVIPSNVDDEGLKSAYSEADKHHWKKEDLEAYEYARMRETDDLARVLLVEEKARLQKQIEIAKNMLADNEPNEKISKYTGLTIDQIEALRTEKD